MPAPGYPFLPSIRPLPRQPLTFNGFGRVMANADGSQSISQIDVTGLADGVTYRDLSVRITPQGMVRMCDPNPNLSSDDPRKC